MRPVFSVDWLAIYAEEQSQFCNAHQLEQAMAEFFDAHYAPELDTFGDDLSLPMPPPGLQGEGVAR